MTDVDGFLRAIADTPGDPLPWLMLADHLAEQGRYGEEAGARWAAKHGKWPMASKKPFAGGWFPEWFDDEDTDGPPKHCLLPDVLVTAKVWCLYGRTKDELVASLQAFLERCGELEWVDGEPVGEVQHA